MADRQRVSPDSVSTSPAIADLDTVFDPENQGSVTLTEPQLTITVDITADYTELGVVGSNIQIMSVSYIPKGQSTLQTVVCFVVDSQYFYKSQCSSW